MKIKNLLKSKEFNIVFWVPILALVLFINTSFPFAFILILIYIVVASWLIASLYMVFLLIKKDFVKFSYVFFGLLISFLISTLILTIAALPYFSPL